jgi:uncharacterized iron-regulated membrane protein
MKFAVANRKVHHWLGIVVVIPLLLVVITGIMLLVRKEFAALQPPTQIGSGVIPTISFEEVLRITRSAAPQANIRSWQDIDRLDVRPSIGIIKVRARNRWEIQIDSSDGRVLQVAYRRSDLIESLHDGTFFHQYVSYLVMLPGALILLTLLITGVHMFFYPHIAKRRRLREAVPSLPISLPESSAPSRK